MPILLPCTRAAFFRSRPPRSLATLGMTAGTVVRSGATSILNLQSSIDQRSTCAISSRIDVSIVSMRPENRSIFSFSIAWNRS